MMFNLWLVFRFNAAGRRLLNTASLLALVGMAVGVASLTVAMAVVAGFQNSLRTAIIDVFGDVVVIHRSENPQKIEDVLAAIKSAAPSMQAYTPFIRLEGLMTGSGQLAGVEVQGFDPKSVDQVLNIRPRVIEGKFGFGEDRGLPLAMAGKALAKRFHLKTGDEFKVVLPVPGKSDNTGFNPKVMSYRLGAILDLGKVEYDERFIVTDLRTAQVFAGTGDSFSGIRLKLSDSSRAAEASSKIAQALGTQYWVSDWSEVNRNLFEAVKIERLVIFFVILIMVIAASFNIASNLFVSVLKRYADISILRALGFSKRDVMRIFINQGLIFGVVGSVAGFILGLLLCLAFMVIQHYVVIMPAETYRVDHIGVVIQPLDVLLIFSASFVVCLLSTLIPARRGANLDPVEGLRYE